MAKSWTSSEVSYLKRYGSTKSPEDLAQRFETDPREVVDKLRELGVAAHEGWGTRQEDPALGLFNEALQALYDKKWSQAASLLEKVAATSEQMEIQERARQYLQICHSRTKKAPKPSSDEDPYLQAVFLKNQGALDESLAIARKRGGGDDERFLYLIASIHALEERDQEAREALERAVELNPKNRVYAFHDPDFASLRDSDEHADLFRLE
jgi:tetratricopeptide (TPR) repeat protein